MRHIYLGITTYQSGGESFSKKAAMVYTIKTDIVNHPYFLSPFNMNLAASIKAISGNPHTQLQSSLIQSNKLAIYIWDVLHGKILFAAFATKQCEKCIHSPASLFPYPSNFALALIYFLAFSLYSVCCTCSV